MLKKRNIFKIILFFLIFSVILVPVSYLLRPDDGYSKETFSGFYAEKKNSLDAVFIGSSAVYRYMISPQLWNKYGITSWVLGSSSQPLDVVPYLIKESQKTQNHSLYVIEIRRLIMEDRDLKQNEYQDKSYRETELRQVTDNLKYSTNRSQLIRDDVSGQKEEWYLDLLHNHSNWKTLTLDSLSLMFYNKKDPVKSASTAATVSKMTGFDVTPYAGKTNELESELEQKLTSVLQYCKEENLNVLFLSTPYVETELSITEENYVADIIKNYGFQYLNCNYSYNDIGIDFTSDFYNSQHTNILGAEKVTDFVGRYLKAHYDLSDEHDDETTAEWDTAYATWAEVRNTQEAAVQKLLTKTT